VQQQIVETVNFPGQALILNVEAGNARFARKLRRVARSRIL